MMEKAGKMSVVEVARICHEVNRAYRKSLDEDPHPPWESASEEMQKSTLAGVRAQLADPVDAEKTHERWVEYKRAQGWKYGKKRDDDAKKHPNVCAWSKLATEQRTKDELFVGTVNSLSEYYEITE